MFFRTPAGARTLDTLIKSQVLYQLSYGCIAVLRFAGAKVHIIFEVAKLFGVFLQKYFATSPKSFENGCFPVDDMYSFAWICRRLAVQLVDGTGVGIGLDGVDSGVVGSVFAEDSDERRLVVVEHRSQHGIIG